MCISVYLEKQSGRANLLLAVRNLTSESMQVEMFIVKEKLQWIGIHVNSSRVNWK